PDQALGDPRLDQDLSEPRAEDDQDHGPRVRGRAAVDHLAQHLAERRTRHRRPQDREKHQDDDGALAPHHGDDADQEAEQEQDAEGDLHGCRPPRGGPDSRSGRDAEGARLLLADLDGAGAEKPAGELGQASVQADVTRAADIERMVDAAWERWGRLDVLVNNAGIVQVKPLLEITEDDWDRIMRV